MNNYVSPFVSAPSFKPKERQTEHMSTYPLKAQQQKDPPTSLSPLARVRPPTVSSLFPYQTSIHTTVPQYVIFFFFKFSFCFRVCTNLSALPLCVFCLQPRLMSQLYVGLSEILHLSFSIPLPPLPCFAAGHGERRN